MVEGYHDSVARLARGLGAVRAWVTPVPLDQVLSEAVRLPERACPVEPLSGRPISCTDIRSLAAKAHAQGDPLAVDVSMTASFGCAAARLGADVCFGDLGEDMSLVAISRSAETALPGISDRLECLPCLDDHLMEGLDCRMASLQALWHAASDAAQVVASYLRCHPRVRGLRYPGLRQDESFSVAARTLEGGFGPLIDYRLANPDPFHPWLRLCCDGRDPHDQVLELERLLSEQ